MSPIPGSPSSNPATDLYRTLCEVVPLDESEVYSWFPEPEYDPHIDAEDGEASEDGFELDEEEENVMGDMDLDEPSWGQAGMELDVDLPQSAVDVIEDRPHRVRALRQTVVEVGVVTVVNVE